MCVCVCVCRCVCVCVCEKVKQKPLEQEEFRDSPFSFFTRLNSFLSLNTTQQEINPTCDEVRRQEYIGGQLCAVQVNQYFKKQWRCNNSVSHVWSARLNFSPLPDTSHWDVCILGFIYICMWDMGYHQSHGCCTFKKKNVNGKIVTEDDVSLEPHWCQKINGK